MNIVITLINKTATITISFGKKEGSTMNKRLSRTPRPPGAKRAAVPISEAPSYDPVSKRKQLISIGANESKTA